ncbi:MAG: histidine kinase [Oscillospiraceae bacterium]|nr:histidine kinase [Oscillospiraceae bacterium]MDD4368980.1 histidine kinase [Oscillospiraceae bacterium]
MDRIDGLLKTQESREKEVRRLELNVLQAQIKPHFLYNTLEAMTWMAKLGQPEQVEKTARSLTQFYRLSLGQGKDLLPLQEEIAIVRHYFAIQNVRYRHHFELFIELPAAMPDFLLPKLTLQPLVENALQHGILESASAQGWVRLAGRQSDGHWELLLQDSGAHLSLTVWQQAIRGDSGSSPSGKQDSYGLKNVERRLCLYFQADHVLYLDQSDPAVTCIVLPFPK